MEIIMCENAHNHPLILMNSFFWLRRHSGHEMDLANQPFIDCPYKSVQLIYPWSEHLLLISPIGNQNSVELKRRVVRMLLSSDVFAWFFPWLSTDTHIRFLAVHRILRWIIVRLILHIQKPLSSSRDTNWLWWVKSSIITTVLYFRRCTPYFWCLPNRYVKISQWVVSMLWPSGWTPKLLRVVLY